MKKTLERNGLESNSAMGSLGRITGLRDLPSDRTLLAHMRQAADLVQSGQRTKSLDRARKSAKRAVRVPLELAAALKKNKLAAKSFSAFSPSCRREYAEWIAEAKRPETKAKRVSEAVEWIAERKPRNWKYMNC